MENMDNEDMENMSAQWAMVAAWNKPSFNTLGSEISAVRRTNSNSHPQIWGKEEHRAGLGQLLLLLLIPRTSLLFGQFNLIVLRNNSQQVYSHLCMGSMGVTKSRS